MRSLVLLLAIAPSTAFTQTLLQAKVAAIAKDAHGTVSVACLLPGTTLNCDLNPHNHSPMQSMFKYPLALTVLHLADTGKLFPDQRPGEPVNATLDRMIRFLPEDRIPGSYSPLQNRYPNANVDVSLRELIQLAAGQSDNGAEEVLLRIVGGPAIVQNYIRSLGITAFQLVDSEHDLDRDESLQSRLDRARRSGTVTPAPCSQSADFARSQCFSRTDAHRLCDWP
jgi:beta-lactamase class A